MRLTALRLAILLAVLLVASGLASSLAQEQPVIVVDGEAVQLSPRDVLAVEVHGERRVAVAYSLPPALQVESVERVNPGFQGLILIKLNSSEGVYDCELVFSSFGPFNVTLSKLGSPPEGPIKTYRCPANATFRVILRLSSGRTFEPQAARASVSPLDVDPWGMVAYGVFAPMFGATLMLDLKDMKRRKANRWSLNDSVALALRYMFYSSAVSLAAVALWTFGSFVYMSLTASSVNVKVGGLVISCAASLALGVAYALARWRGWYELIDEED